METPEEMLGRLERMGESRVRNLIASGHFAQRTIGLVKGWLTQKEEARQQASRKGPSVDEVSARFELLVQESVETAKKASEVAELASRAASMAHRLALGGIIAGGVGLLIAVMALFAMILR